MLLLLLLNSPVSPSGRAQLAVDHRPDGGCAGAPGPCRVVPFARGPRGTHGGGRAGACRGGGRGRVMGTDLPRRSAALVRLWVGLVEDVRQVPMSAAEELDVVRALGTELRQVLAEWLPDRPPTAVVG